MISFSELLFQALSRYRQVTLHPFTYELPFTILRLRHGDCKMDREIFYGKGETSLVKSSTVTSEVSVCAWGDGAGVGCNVPVL